MPQTEQFHTAPHEQWEGVYRLMRDVLTEGMSGPGYCQQLSQALGRCAEGDETHLTLSVLPILTCQASGGDPRQAVPVKAAWQLLRLAAKLLDDVEDGESDRPAQDANIATGLLFLAQLGLGTLAEQDVPPDCIQLLCQELGRVGLRTCAGQHAELVHQAGMPHIDPDAWLQIALAKSGEPCAWAAWAGARVAGADEHSLACYREYGSRLGVLLQVADDFNGVWHPHGASDLSTGNITLPVCYALATTKDGERNRLEALLKQAAQGVHVAEAQARKLLTDVGAQDYLLVVARVQHRYATAALQRAQCVPAAGRQLVALLDQVLPIPNCKKYTEFAS